MPEQQTLPLPGATPALGKFVIPDEPAPETPAPAASEPSEPAQNTGEQAPPATSEAKPEEKKEEVTPEVAAKREGRRFERRLDKAFRQRAEAQARADLLEKRLAELEKAQAPKAVEGEPTLAQFDFDPEKYAQAKAEFAKTQVQKEIEAKQKTEAQQQTHQKLVSSWEEKLAAAEDGDEELDPRLSAFKPVNAFMAAIMDAENGVQIAQWLLKNPKEDARIGALPVWSQIREVGKLEAKLLSEPEKPKTPSKAPAPITPLTGVAQVATDVPSEQDDMETWIKKRQKQVYGKRKS